MTDLTNVIEAAGTGIGGTAVLFGALWKPVIKRHDKNKAITAFLVGTPAAPGMIPVKPAGDRLVDVESGVADANQKLDGHTSALAGLAAAVESLAKEVEKISHKVENNVGIEVTASDNELEKKVQGRIPERIKR